MGEESDWEMHINKAPIRLNANSKARIEVQGGRVKKKAGRMCCSAYMRRDAGKGEEQRWVTNTEVKLKVGMVREKKGEALTG